MAAIAAGLFVIGCSSENGGGDTGSAPTITDLSLSPGEVEAGKATALSGTVGIDDSDGDVAQIGVEVTLPNGTKQSLPKAPAQAAGGVKEGQLALAMAFGPPSAGAYELTVFVVDSKGHESNRLTTTINAK